MRYQVKMFKNLCGLKIFALPLVTLVIFVFGCARPTDETKKSLNISIAVPGNALQLSNALSGKMSIASLANSELIHVSISITAADIPQGFHQIWESCRNCFGTLPPPPTQFAMQSPIPSGKARLTQLFAAYRDSSTGQTLFYYGEQTQDFDKETVVVYVPLAQLNSETGNPIVEGRVAGRYLTGTDSGPTGRVAMKYVPPGINKQAMLVGHEEIINGWFNFFMPSGVSFSYTVEKTDEVLWGGPVSTDSTAIQPANSSSPQRLRTYFPVHKRYDMGLSTYFDEDAKTITWGYYGLSTAISTKYVCSSGTPASLTKMYKYVAVSPPVLTLDRGSTPPTYAAISSLINPLSTYHMYGGFNGTDMSSSCNSYTDNSANLFSQFLKVTPNMYDGSGNDQAGGFRGPFILGAGNSIFNIYDSGGFKGITANLLPNVSSIYSSFQVFKRLNTANTNAYLELPNCKKIASGDMGFVTASSIVNVAGGATIDILTNITPAEVTNGVSAVICPVYSANGQLADEGGIYLDPRSFGFGVNLGNIMINSAPNASDDYCYSMSVGRTGSIANSVVVNLSTNLANPSIAKFYSSSSSCENDVSPLTPAEVTIPGGSSQTTVYFRRPTISGQQAILTSSFSASITASAPQYNVGVKNFMIHPKVTGAQFSLGGSTNFTMSECKELIFTYLNSQPTPQMETTSRVVIFQTSSVTVNFYADNTCTTQIGTSPTFNYNAPVNQSTFSIYFKATNVTSGIMFATSPAPLSVGNGAISLNPSNFGVTVTGP